MKFALGVTLALAIGSGSRLAGVPLPAPTALIGAMAVLAMTLGYVLAGRFARRRVPEGSARNGKLWGESVDRSGDRR